MNLWKEEAWWLYRSIIVMLQVEQITGSLADARGKANNYLSHLLKKDVVLYLHFLHDMTSALSLAMQ